MTVAAEDLDLGERPDEPLCSIDLVDGMRCLTRQCDHSNGGALPGVLMSDLGNRQRISLANTFDHWFYHPSLGLK